MLDLVTVLLVIAVIAGLIRNSHDFLFESSWLLMGALTAQFVLAMIEPGEPNVIRLVVITCLFFGAARIFAQTLAMRHAQRIQTPSQHHDA